MRTRWPILALLCLLASLLVPGIASASTAAGAETRVWAFELQGQARVGVERSLTLERHQGCEPTARTNYASIGASSEEFVGQVRAPRQEELPGHVG